MVYVAAFGTDELHPEFDAWLVARDKAQHQAGWMFFRQEDWSFPLGAVSRLAYPLGTSIVFTDSLPLLAIPLKLFLTGYQGSFQYLGLWGFLSFVLQAGVAILLLRKVTQSTAILLPGAALFLLSPLFISRLTVTSISGHWLILLAMLFYFSPELPVRARLIVLLGLELIAIGTNVYLFAIILPILLVSSARTHLMGSRTGPGKLLLELSIMALFAGALFATLGYLNVADPGTGGFGTQAADVLTYLNSERFPALVPALVPFRLDLEEGYAYLGAGALALVAVACAGLILSSRARSELMVRRNSWIPIAAVSVLLFVYSLSQLIRFSGTVVADASSVYEPIRTLTSTFRASGRFSWPLHYLLLLGAICLAARLLPKWLAVVALCTAVMLQIVDTGALWQEAREKLQFSVGFDLNAPAWRMLRDQYDLIEVIPQQIVDSTGTDQQDPEALGALMYLAAREGIAINSAYLARVQKMAAQQVSQETMRSFERGELNPRSVYVLHPSIQERGYERTLARFVCGEANEFVLCVLKDRETALRDWLLAHPPR